jgi:hypothetical protein
MLHRSIPTMEALVHSILISEVKDMTNDVLQAQKAFISKKKTLNLVCGLNFNNFQEKINCIDFKFLSAIFPPLGLIFFKTILNLLAISFFLSSRTHRAIPSYLFF